MSQNNGIQASRINAYIYGEATHLWISQMEGCVPPGFKIVITSLSVSTSIASVNVCFSSLKQHCH